MSFETKQEVLEKILSRKKPKCKHCESEMQLWEVPEISVSDGLGWGVPYLFVCFNDDCKIYKSSWEEFEEKYGHSSSCRCMNYPGTDQYEFIPVFSPQGGHGQIIDKSALDDQEKLKEDIKRGFSILADCYVVEDTVQMLKMLTDPLEPIRVRIKAAEMLGDVSDTEVIEPLRYYKYGNNKIVKAVEEAIEKIHNRCFTMECPYCAEIVKKRAKLCKHCNKEVSGGAK